MLSLKIVISCFSTIRLRKRFLNNHNIDGCFKQLIINNMKAGSVKKPYIIGTVSVSLQQVKSTGDHKR